VKHEMPITGAKNRDLLLLVACCSALATLVPVTLYQVGALSSLPDPPSPIFDSESITTSRAANPLGIPDGVLGLASFGTTVKAGVKVGQSGGVKVGQRFGVRLWGVSGAKGLWSGAEEALRPRVAAGGV
jgi:uncharacterized membrane protein